LATLWADLEWVDSTKEIQLHRNSATQLLKKIGLTTLQTRKARGDMIEVYKIMTGKDKIDKEQFFPLADSNYGL